MQTAVDTQNADPGELLSVGMNAHKEDQLAIAITAFRRTARSNSHDDAPLAATNLGTLEKELCDP